MGLLFVLVLACVSAAMIYFFGYALWVIVVLGSLWLVALVISALGGHHGFGGHGKTDLPFVIAGLVISAAIIIPEYNAQQPCAQAKIALAKFADAQNEYFSEYKTYAPALSLLNLTQNPQVYIMILKADKESFLAAGSHMSCNEDNKGTLKVFMWDSAKGGLQ